MREWSRSCVLVAMIASAVGCGFSTAAGMVADGQAVDGTIADAQPIDAEPIDAPSVPADWWDASYTHRLPITIDGTLLTGTLTNFPVLVTLAAPFAFNAAQSAGNDLVFIDSADDGSGANTTQLSYDLDTLAVGGPWRIWVKVPTLTMGAAHVITLYYGKPTATATANGMRTFTGEISVHHLGPTLIDATTRGHNGTATGTTSTVGAIGNGTTFNGTSDVVALPVSTDYDFTTQLSLSLWIKSAAFTDYTPFVAKGDATWRAQAGSTAAAIGSTHCAQFGTNASMTAYDNTNGATVLDDNHWHYVAMVYDGAHKRVYVDGVADVTAEAYTLTINVNTNAVLFGENADPSPKRFFAGSLDEIRITTAARGAPWVRAEHDTVTVAGFTTLGADQLIP